MKTITVPAQPLKAVSLCKSKDDSRRVLRGVLVKPTAEGIRLAATDGFVLGTVECDGWKCEESAIIGEDFAKSLPRSAHAVQLDFGSKTATVIDKKGREGKTHHFEVIEGDFPKIDNLLPGDGANEGFAGFIDPGFIERAGKFHSAATGNPVQFHAVHDLQPVHTGSEAKDIRAVCTVMPIRCDGGFLPKRDEAKRKADSPKKAVSDSPKKERKAKKAKEIPADFAEVAEKLSSAGSEVKFSGCNLWATHVDGFDFEAEGFRRCKKETSKHCGQWFKKAA